MTSRSLLLAGSLMGGALSVGAPQPTPPAANVEGWRHFAGSWSASGTRHTLPSEADRDAAIVQLSGSLVLTVEGTLGRGFQGQAIAFDGGDVRVGRAVWTDDGGNQIFSTLTGGPFSGGQRLLGTITGGTGRFAGVTGEYAFTWQYVVMAPDGVVQGRAGDLSGRVRRGGQP
ncbi:MAG TPA: hypothetical protein VD833_19360 [Vicinamibacterales bacterium]|nr:hypothetical protein [Vicinamibacterales bacterium]